ncbi:methyltransferase domain-containing protein [Candidatus Peregrinibacteria bacterium]|nr:methyltransferase domain-containing protein [Candidatus Peregrinibacteria bacterium]
MIEYQRLIMADTVRTAAFEKALRTVVKPGCTLVDVGSGTGFLAFLASKFGAKRCILIEREPEFIKISKEMARRSNITNCTFICGDSRDIKKSFNADIVISETLGNFAYEENIIETLPDARRFLKSGGVMIPQSLRIHAAPVVRAAQWKEVTVWDRVGFDLDWSPCKERSVNNMYVKKVEKADLLPVPSHTTQWDEVLFAHGKIKSIRSANLSWKLNHPATIYGICLWWDCTLIPGITLSTSPFAPPTHWQQIFLPIPDPIAGASHDTIACTLRSDSRRSVKINVQWEVLHKDKTGKELVQCRMDMRRGAS